MYRPITLAIVAFAGLSACVPVLFPVPLVTPAAPAGPVALLPATAASDMAFDVALTAFRAENNLPSLTAHSPLDQVAAAHTGDMVTNSYLSPTSPDGSSPNDRVKAAGIATCGTSEVVARGPDTSTDAFARWMASAEHRAILADPTVRNYGLGGTGNVWSVVLVRPCAAG